MYGPSLTSVRWSTWSCDVQTSLDERDPGKVTIVNSGPEAFCYDYAVHEHLDQGGRDFVANVLAAAFWNGVQGNL